MAAPIVCAVGRDTPKAVVRVASDLAQEMDCRLELVHVCGKSTLPRLPCKGPRRSGRELLTEMLCEVPAAVDAEVRLERGRPSQALLDVCAETRAGLLVVGSPEMRSFAGRRSRTHRLLAFGADCPVIIVPRGVRRPSAVSAGGQAVVCGVEWSRRSVRLMGLAADLADRLDRRLVLVHPGGRRSLALTSALSRASGCGVVTVEADPSAEVLEAVARTYDADLVLGGDHHAGLSGNFGRGSAAPRLVAQGDRPVVVLPERAEWDGPRRPHSVAPLADAA